MPSHWGHKKLNIVSQSSLHWHTAAASGRLRRGELSLQAHSTNCKRRIDGFKGDEVAIRFARRRHHQRRRIVGSAEHGLQSEVAGDLPASKTTVTRSCPGGSQTAGGDISKLVDGFPFALHCKDATARIRLSRWKRCAARLNIAASEKVRHSFTRKSFALIRTRIRMTKSFTARRKSARPTRSAIRSRRTPSS